jgi:hypothetical protein
MLSKKKVRSSIDFRRRLRCIPKKSAWTIPTIIIHLHCRRHSESRASLHISKKKILFAYGTPRIPSPCITEPAAASGSSNGNGGVLVWRWELNASTGNNSELPRRVQPRWRHPLALASSEGAARYHVFEGVSDRRWGFGDPAQPIYYTE